MELLYSVVRGRNYLIQVSINTPKIRGYSREVLSTTYHKNHGLVPINDGKYVAS